jgi:hypothetical protein
VRNIFEENMSRIHYSTLLYSTLLFSYTGSESLAGARACDCVYMRAVSQVELKSVQMSTNSPHA